jgi:hypothetical protein
MPLEKHNTSPPVDTSDPMDNDPMDTSDPNPTDDRDSTGWLSDA